MSVLKVLKINQRPLSHVSREAWLLSVLWIQLPRQRVIITTTFGEKKMKHCLKVLSKAEQCWDSVALHTNLLLHREEVTPGAKERGLLRPVCPRRYAVSVMMIRSSRSMKLSPCGIIPSLNLPWLLCYSQPASRIMLLPLLVPWLQGLGGPKGDLVETSKTQRQVFHCSSGEGAPLTFPMAWGVWQVLGPVLGSSQLTALASLAATLVWPLLQKNNF